jgi:hypothetical protein
VRPALAAWGCLLFASRDSELALLPFISVRLGANVYIREGMKKSENVKQPQDHGYHHHGIQDRFDRSSHGDERIDQPEQDPHNDQNHQYLK